MTDFRIALTQVVAVLRSHRQTMAICFGVVLLGTLLLAILLPRTYFSEAQLLVRLGRENMRVDPMTTLSDTQTRALSADSRKQEIETVAAILSNRSLLEKVVDSIGHGTILDKGSDRSSSSEAARIDFVGSVAAPVGNLLSLSALSPRDKAVRVLEDNLDVEAIRDTSLVRIAFQSHNPQVAQNVISQLVNFYLDEHMRLYRTPGAHEFLSGQTAAMRDRLKHAEIELRDQKGETGLVAIEQQREAMVNQIAKLENDLSEVQAAIAEVDAYIKHLRNAFAGLSKTEIMEESIDNDNYAADGMRQQLYTLQLREKELSAIYTDNHVKVRQIREQVAAAEDVLEHEEKWKTETIRGPSRAYEETLLQLIKKEPLLIALKAKSGVLDQQLLIVNKKLHKLNKDEVRLAELSREVEIHDNNYRTYATDTEQARIDHALNNARMSNISIVQPATLNITPRFPNITVILFLGLFVAASGSVGSAFFFESFNRSEQRSSQLTS